MLLFGLDRLLRPLVMIGSGCPWCPLVVPRVVAMRLLGVCRQPGCVVLCLRFALLTSFVFFSFFSFPMLASLQVRFSPNLPIELPLAMLGGIMWGMVWKLG